MKKREVIKSERLREAKNVFIDYNAYSDEETLLGFYTLLKAICYNHTMTSKSASLLKLENALSKIEKNYSDVIVYRYLGNYTLEESASILHCVKETVRLRQIIALNELRKLSKDFLLKPSIDFNKKIETFKNAILTQTPSTEDIEVKDLPLSKRTYNCLMQNNITTASQLCLTPSSELFSIRNFGIKCYEEISQIKNDLLITYL